MVQALPRPLRPAAVVGARSQAMASPLVRPTAITTCAPPPRPHCHRRRVRSHAVSRDGRDVDREVYTCLNGPHTRPGRAARSTRTGGAGRQAHDLAGLARRLGVAARQYHVGALLELLLRLLPARASATPPFTTGPPGAHSVHTSGLARRWWRWRRRSGGSVWIESLLATKTVLF